MSTYKKLDVKIRQNNTRIILIMSYTRSNIDEIAEMATVFAVAAGAGTAAAAGARGLPVAESAFTVAAGTALVAAGLGFFSKKQTGTTATKKPQSLIPPAEVVAIVAMIELLGTAAGSIGARLFVNTAASTAPFANAALGFPVTIGVLCCAKLLSDYCRQKKDENQNISRPRPR